MCPHDTDFDEYDRNGYELLVGALIMAVLAVGVIALLWAAM